MWPVKTNRHFLREESAPYKKKGENILEERNELKIGKRKKEKQTLDGIKILTGSKKKKLSHTKLICLLDKATFPKAGQVKGQLQYQPQ